MNDDESVTWISQQGPVDATLKTIAMLLVQRAGGRVTLTRDEWELLDRTYGGTAALHVVGDSDEMIVIVTTQDAVLRNPTMQPEPMN